MKRLSRALLRRLWELRFAIPLTPLGVAVIAASLWVRYHYGEQQVDFVLYAASLVALVVVAVCIAMVLVVGGVLTLRLRRQRGIADLSLESGVRAATGYSFPRFRVWPMVQVRMSWADPARVEVSMERTGGRVEEVVLPLERGEHTFVRRRFFVSDIFGISRIGLTRRAAQRARIVPGPARVSGNVISHIVGGDALSHPTGPAAGELLDMRRYAYGDPLRHVLWKAYARTRQLLVRTPERAITPSPSATAYMIAGREDEPTASAARFFVEQGLLGDDFRFLADGAKEPTSDRAEALDQIVASVHHRARGGLSLRRFVDRARQEHRRNLVLFVPPTVGPWLERVEACATLLGDASVVLAIDHSVGAANRGWLRRALFAEGASQSRALRSLPRVVSRLSRLGMQVKVIHRPSGELIAPSALVEVES